MPKAEEEKGDNAKKTNKIEETMKIIRKTLINNVINNCCNILLKVKTFLDISFISKQSIVNMSQLLKSSIYFFVVFLHKKALRIF